MQNNSIPDTKPVIYLKDYKPSPYGITHVDLKFELFETETLVSAKLHCRANPGTLDGEALVLDGDELDHVSLSLDGRAMDSEEYRIDDHTLTIINPPVDRPFVVETVVRINPKANTKLMGLYRSNDRYCTQCEAEGFRRITWYLDRPDVLATFTTRIEADLEKAPILLGNGNPAEHGTLENGRHFAIWHDPHPKPSYLFALVAGEFDHIHEDFVTASGNPVKLGIYVETGKAEQARYAMDALIRSMRWDEEKYGREYDLSVFNIVAVSDFNMGAMENKGLNIFNDKYILADQRYSTDTDYANIEAIVAHEYFHNWTGNRITCRDWFQLCLKEGLTVYRDQQFSSDMRSANVQRISMVNRLRKTQFAEDSGPLSHPVRPSSYREINNFYTATVYEKGAELIRMLALMLGEGKFRAGMDLYFERHDGQAVTIEDFLNCFAEASGRDLDHFSQWYFQSGTPQLLISRKYTASDHRFTLVIEQVNKPTADQQQKSALQIPVKFSLLAENGDLITPTHATGGEIVDNVMTLKERKHTFCFEDIKSRPVLSINQGFSAPVIVRFDQPKADLMHLAAHDLDSFNRWQSCHTLNIDQIKSAYHCLEKSKQPIFDDDYLDVIGKLGMDDCLDKAFRAKVLDIVDEGDMAQELGQSVNPDLVHSARRAFQSAVGETLYGNHDVENFVKCSAISDEYCPDAHQSGHRALVNLLLDLGVLANNAFAEKASLEQYETSNNMTDKLASFIRIVHFHADPNLAKRIIDDFYASYHDNPLVLDKWFAVQAMTSGNESVQRVRALINHEQYTHHNPNRARSVIWTFANANPTGFAASDGTGFDFVAEMIQQIDPINPQVAARILTSFRSIELFEETRKAKAYDALAALKSGNKLSTDVTELLDKIYAQR